MALARPVRSETRSVVLPAALAQANRLRLPAVVPARHLAGLALLFNLPFVLFAVQRGAFDTYVHVFLADHYRRAWWSLWEPRWYTGFSMASYPPLAHQLIALLSWPLEHLVRFFANRPEVFPGEYTWVGEELAYVIVLLAVLALLPLAIRAFARVFTGPRTANVAAVLAIFVPAICLAAWAFGQLPTLLGTAVILAALARGHAFVTGGRGWHLIQAVGLAALAGATHHGVFLLVPFAGAATAWRAMQARKPAGGRWGVIARVSLWGGLSALAVIAVLWPFLDWSRGQSLQTPIDHASRHNLLTDVEAAAFFFWPMYGPLLLIVPWLLGRAWRLRGVRPLAALWLLLFVLGLGGTTRLPRLLFGQGWSWLTYDRFALWAAISMLPVAGALAVTAMRRWPAAAARAVRGCLVLLAASGCIAGWFAVLARSQPPAVDMVPLVNFLNDPAQRPYRYLTLGLGDQFAKLSALTMNGSLDGNYHTARQVPELRSSGLGALDTAVWNPQGGRAVQPFLAQAGDYGVRWVFVNNPDYTRYLNQTGWQFRFFVGDVGAWEKADVQPPRPSPPPEDGLASLWWGAVPLLALALTGASLLVDHRPLLVRSRILAALKITRTAAWAAALGLSQLWWVHIIQAGAQTPVARVFQGTPVYASDLAAGVTVLAWLAERALRGERPRFGPRGIGWGLLALIGATFVSVPGAVEAEQALAVATHGLLMGAWFWVTVNDPPTPRLAGVVLSAMLVGQGLVALQQAVMQGTAGLQGFYIWGPAAWEPQVSGASVVQSTAGVRWLRAYGTLPHPNILGGLLVLGLGGAGERYLSTGRRAWLAVAAAGAAALVLTFSRAAWVGAVLMFLAGGYTAWRVNSAHWPRFWRLAVALTSSALLALLPLLPFLMARVLATPEPIRLEQNSVEHRVLLGQAAVEMIRAHPLAGVGVGNYMQALAALAPPDIPQSYVHSVPLLIAAETGLAGGAAMAILCGGTVWRLWTRRRTATLPEVAMALVWLGVLAAAQFDYYWWTFAPTRLALMTSLGLWVGWGEAAIRADSRAR